MQSNGCRNFCGTVENHVYNEFHLGMKAAYRCGIAKNAKQNKIISPFTVIGTQCNEIVMR